MKVFASLRLWPLFAAALVAPSPLGVVQPAVLSLVASLGLRPGDIVFRRGVGALSRAVLATEERAEFSHVGLIVMHGGRVWVVHAVPAEAAGERDGTKIELLEAFLESSHASRAAVYRLDDSRIDHAAERAAQAASASEEMARRALPFDFDFDLARPGTLYCTKLVLRAYGMAGVDLKVKASDPLGPFVHHAIVLPGDLLRSPLLTRIGP